MCLITTIPPQYVLGVLGVCAVLVCVAKAGRRFGALCAIAFRCTCVHGVDSLYALLLTQF
jgi:hypothetical protein